MNKFLKIFNFLKLPPEAVQLIKFVDKKSIKEYLNEDQLFVHMGGSVINNKSYFFIALNKNNFTLG